MSYNFTNISGNLEFTNTLKQYFGSHSWDDKDELFNILSASTESFGNLLIEKIANYTKNISDIDICELDSLYSIANLLDIYDLVGYNISYPTPLYKLMSQLSISRNYLLQYGIKLDTNELSAVYNNLETSYTESSGLVSAYSGTIITDNNYLTGFIDDTLTNHIEYHINPNNYIESISSRVLDYQSFLESINPNSEIDTFSYSVSSQMISASVPILRNLALDISYHRSTLQNMMQKYAIIGTNTAIENIVTEYISKTFTKNNNWRYSNVESYDSTLLSSNIADGLMQNLSSLKDLHIDIIEYYDPTEYLNIQTDNIATTSIITGTSAVYIPITEIDISGNFLTGYSGYVQNTSLSSITYSAEFTQAYLLDNIYVSKTFLSGDMTSPQTGILTGSYDKLDYINIDVEISGRTLTASIGGINKIGSIIAEDYLEESGNNTAYTGVADNYYFKGQIEYPNTIPEYAGSDIATIYSPYITHNVNAQLYNNGNAVSATIETYDVSASVLSSNDKYYSETILYTNNINLSALSTYIPLIEGNAKYWNGDNLTNAKIISEHTSGDVYDLYNNIGFTTSFQDIEDKNNDIFNTFAVSAYNDELSSIQQRYIKDGLTPVLNYKNTSFPTISPQPFVWNLVEKIKEKYPNLLASLLFTDQSSTAVYSGMTDSFGNIIDSWKYNHHEYTGYQTQYEANLNKDYNNNENKNAGIDNVFNMDALSAYLATIDYTNVLSSYYSHINATYNIDGILSADPRINTQLTDFKSNIQNINNKLIYNYGTDIYENVWSLYKSEDELSANGDLFIRYKDHPIAFPAYNDNYLKSQLQLDTDIISVTGLTNILSGNCNDFNIYDQTIWLYGNDKVYLFQTSNQYNSNYIYTNLYGINVNPITNDIPYSIDITNNNLVGSFDDENYVYTVLYDSYEASTDRLSFVIYKYGKYDKTFKHSPLIVTDIPVAPYTDLNFKLTKSDVIIHIAFESEGQGDYTNTICVFDLNINKIDYIEKPLVVQHYTEFNICSGGYDNTPTTNSILTLSGTDLTAGFFGNDFAIGDDFYIASSNTILDTHINVGCVSKFNNSTIQDNLLSSNVLLSGNDYEHFGYSIDLTGNTLAIGIPNYDNLPSDLAIGKVEIFKSDAYSQTITSDYANGVYDKFGENVNLYENQLYIGAPNTNIGLSAKVGYVSVYERTNPSSNYTLSATLIGEDNYSNFGTSIDSCSSYIAIGAPYYGSNNEGKLYIYDHNLSAITSISGTSTNLGRDVEITNIYLFVSSKDMVKIYDSNFDLLQTINGSNNFGWSISYDESINTLVIGEPNYTESGVKLGKAHIYSLQHGTFKLIQTLPNQFRENVELAGKSVKARNGKLLIGCPNYNNKQGRVFHYNWNGVEYV